MQLCLGSHSENFFLWAESSKVHSTILILQRNGKQNWEYWCDILWTYFCGPKRSDCPGAGRTGGSPARTGSSRSRSPRPAASGTGRPSRTPLERTPGRTAAPASAWRVQKCRPWPSTASFYKTSFCKNPPVILSIIALPSAPRFFNSDSCETRRRVGTYFWDQG